MHVPLQVSINSPVSNRCKLRVLAAAAIPCVSAVQASVAKHAEPAPIFPRLLPIMAPMLGHYSKRGHKNAFNSGMTILCPLGPTAP